MISKKKKLPNPQGSGWMEVIQFCLCFICLVEYTFKRIQRHRRHSSFLQLLEKPLIVSVPSLFWQGLSWNVLKWGPNLLFTSTLPKTRLSVGETKSESCRLISCSLQLQVLLWISCFYCSEWISVPPQNSALPSDYLCLAHSMLL